MKTTKLIAILVLFGITCTLASEPTPLSFVNPLMGTWNPNGLWANMLTATNLSTT
jgi:hypothetical protein